MKSFIRVTKALSDPNRVRIIKLLGHKELCVCELKNLLGLAQSTVSKHLKVLDDAGLLAFRKDGPWIIYRLANDSESHYAAAMLEHLAVWLEDDPELIEMRLQLKHIDRERICAA
ncbi:MAG: winged helix-turn-helix transcriptional regulator [Desulfobulbaceae bacterium]|uniref:Winged helix-turn-helix transcriptional regulator n=1 Tax=Candidatus Desulfatifera sulfidica TaxID=2841691 RepID=A0A8J6N8I1_9BACT|nr:winged helix-turn-helix transcriptional regulator [Candidatus Desulfatifera sulfidica]